MKTTMLKEIQVDPDTSFPLLIRTREGKRILCSAVHDLPAGTPFTVIETNCDIEIRHLPAMRKE